MNPLSIYSLSLYYADMSLLTMNINAMGGDTVRNSIFATLSEHSFICRKVSAYFLLLLKKSIKHLQMEKFVT